MEGWLWNTLKLLSHNGGNVPVSYLRSLLALTLAARENISPGIACSSSIRDIAKRSERAASTVLTRARPLFLVQDSAEKGLTISS
jgi:hypothetical protein